MKSQNRGVRQSPVEHTDYKGAEHIGMVDPYAGDELKAVGLESVRVGGVVGEHVDKTVEGNFLAINVDDDFLKRFREKSYSGAESYLGLGKLIDAAVRFAAYTGDERVIRLKRYLIDEVIKAQLDDGYIGTFGPDMRIWGFWDVHEISYLILGLTADYRFFGTRASLEAASRAADYIIDGWSGKPDDYPGKGKRIPWMTSCGMDTAFLRLYDATGDSRYLDFCADERGLRNWNHDIVLGRHGRVEGHAYSYISKCLAQVELYRRTGDPGLLTQTNRMLDFWSTGDGMVITGACGQDECWHNTQDGSGNLGESCATAYSIRLLDNLLRLTGNPHCGDLMERVIYNALFAAQSPDGRYIRYYSPFEGKREYWHLDSYCCPNNYRRIIAELPGMVYYGSQNGIVVNLYTASSASFELGQGITVGLEQTAEYPRSGDVTLKVHPVEPVTFTLSLRIPKWADGTQVFVNGMGVDKSVKPGYFLNIRRRWSSEDEVKILMPMPLRLIKGRVDQAGRVAIMRGPTVFTLNPQMHPELAGIDLRRISIDPSTVKEKVIDGIPQCRVETWIPEVETSQPTNGSLVLTEFPDPEGEMIYFRVPDPRIGMNDELFGPKR